MHSPGAGPGPARQAHSTRNVSPTIGGAGLLRAVGLMADGPVLWGRPVPPRGPGVFLVELQAPRPTAPIDFGRIRAWLARVPELRLDGEQPTDRQLVSRLQEYWIPGQAIVYIGGDSRSVGQRLAALARASIGDEGAARDAQWLLVLDDLPHARIWWATTDAPTEYVDALLDAFAAAVEPAITAEARSALREPRLLLPFAVQARPTGERRDHAITNAIRRPQPATSAGTASGGVVQDGSRAGTSPRGSRRAGGSPSPTRATRRPGTRSTARPAAAGRELVGAVEARNASERRSDSPVELSGEGMDRMETELRELRDVARPALVKRVAAARELGDLRENAEYQTSRQELGFLDGRVQTLESRLRNAVLVEKRTGPTAGMGSTVRVESEGEELTFVLVGSAEADAAAGRISTSSPVGRALSGRAAGDEVVVATPGGEDRYRIIEVH